MTTRQRLTWGSEARNASAHPATPDEGPASPAHQPEPDADKYQNGDTSSWAEDPHPGPYPNSAHPATPDEGPASPAYKAAAMERRAHTCIRIATALMGDPTGDPEKVAAVEAHAITLMDLPDDAIKASLGRLGMDEEEDEEESKKASFSREATAKIASNESRIARLERILVRLAAEEEEEVEVEEEAKKKAGDDSDEESDDDEAKKKAGDDSDDESDDDEAKKKAGYGMDDEAMLEQMLMEEGMMEGAVEEEVIDPMGEFDSMGMSDMPMDDDEQMILAKLFNKNAGDDDDDDDDDDSEEEEVEEEVVEEEAKKKKASAKPQPKRASKGATKLGGPVAKEAGSEIESLSQIWETAPDVSGAFK